MVPISILDLAPIVHGGTASVALQRALDLAQHAERWGYLRYWLAEHHNMPGIASAATSVVVAHVAGGTKSIRVGAGGIMLPNHAPLVVAEQFGTLEALFPGRIDLGLGRAPGTDLITARALRRGKSDTAETFPQDVIELLGYFRPSVPGQSVQAFPGAGLRVPVWLLGSSLFSAQLAAALGLPYAFASHFAPELLEKALDLYRRGFRPSDSLKKPYSMVAVQVFAADTDAEAERLFTSLQLSFVNLRRGAPTQLPAPVDTMEGRWSELERTAVEMVFREAIVGSEAKVEDGIGAFVRRTGVDELMVTASIHDHEARLHSFELVAKAAAKLSLPANRRA